MPDKPVDAQIKEAVVLNMPLDPNGRNSDRYMVDGLTLRDLTIGEIARKRGKAAHNHQFVGC